MANLLSGLLDLIGNKKQDTIYEVLLTRLFTKAGTHPKCNNCGVDLNASSAFVVPSITEAESITPGTTVLLHLVCEDCNTKDVTKMLGQQFVVSCATRVADLMRDQIAHTPVINPSSAN